MKFRIGIDVGGTFTDLFLWAEDGTVGSFKVLSTPEDPSLGVLDGMRVMAEARGMAVVDFARATALIVHGTTVTTNAVLTRGGARTALLTTEGVRDALEMRRGIRERQYDNRFQNVVPLVPRHLRRPVAGRLDFRGEEITPLDLDSVRRAIEDVRKDGVTSVAVCFMHSYANPAHERAATELVRAALPDVFTSVSSDVLPVIRFYDRVSTTVLSAYVGPVLRSYLQNLTARLAGAGFTGVLLIMQSNGGLAVPEITERTPASTLLSGPAGGPRAAAVFAKEQGRDDCILVDMGGTSFDASLVRRGAATLRHDGEIDRLRIALPMLDIVTIGAGGGSIGWIDEGGLLRVGPASAGAKPGPACYGRGGERPTCTDADLVLGYLDPEYFAGGRLRLDVSAARRAIEQHVARPLSLALHEAAAGMYRVINANMANGVREITVKRGLDPREFPLIVAGGAGPLHACMIASELGIPMVIVPAAASTLCATGMLLSDLQHDFVRSVVGPLAEIDARRLREVVAEMTSDGERQLAAEGAREVEHQLALDLRYLKQYHEVTLPIARELLTRGDWDGVAKAFHAEHDRLYGYQLAAEGTGLELINVRVRCVGRTRRPELPRLQRGGRDASRVKKGMRSAFVPETGAFADVPVYDGHRLLAGNVIPGPALLERTDTTIFLSGAYLGEVDEAGSVVLSAQEVQA
ncbi:MAG: hydantoinase/oxoprolinase family protein [Planctomycetes bacterium]|nr:hydantoinase/oxoprolinase family protein [Planctomycetota bacterium]